MKTRNSFLVLINLKVINLVNIFKDIDYINRIFKVLEFSNNI
jgi:hypothetical protein